MANEKQKRFDDVELSEPQKRKLEELQAAVDKKTASVEKLDAEETAGMKAFGVGLMEVATKGLRQKPEELAMTAIKTGVSLCTLFTSSINYEMNKGELGIHKNNLQAFKDAVTGNVKTASPAADANPGLEPEGQTTPSAGAPATGGGSGQSGRRGGFAGLGNESAAAGPSFL